MLKYSSVADPPNQAVFSAQINPINTSYLFYLFYFLTGFLTFKIRQRKIFLMLSFHNFPFFHTASFQNA